MPDFDEELIELETIDSETVALWKICKLNCHSEKHIFLTHGTFSNKKICTAISKFFADKGYICWILEWRGHGSSPEPEREFDFSTIAEFDFPVVFNYLFSTVKIKKIDCITHSGGGICLTMFLIQNQEYVNKISTISMFSCQSFGACFNKKSYIKVFVSKLFSSILGFIPGRALGLGEQNEIYSTMKQWFDWNLSGEFFGNDGFDFKRHMKILKIPVLSICSKGDRFIAPWQGCRKYLKAFDNSENLFLLVSLDNGYAEDYNHSRVLLSRNSKNEIWPVVVKWIENH